jgi:hypothetical protein
MQVALILLTLLVGLQCYDRVTFESAKDRTITWTADSFLPIN